MDKYEYKVKSDEIKDLITQGEFAQASGIADTIDWRRVKSFPMLCTISDLYKENRRYEDAKNVMLLAYDRKPGGRTICYSLCELCLKTEEFAQAVKYYKEFEQAAPKDPSRFILQYKLCEAQGASLEERIGILEKLKKRDYREEWAYELAYLYHRMGLPARCVEECDELILWFGEGKYVVKAMELKMLHEPLTPEQQEKYEHRFDEAVQEVPAEEAAQAEYTQEEYAQEEYVQEEAYVQDGGQWEYAQPDGQWESYTPQEEQWEDGTRQEAYGQAGDEWVPADGQEAAETGIEAETGDNQGQGEELDIQVKTVDVGKFNTINLQAELAAGLQEVLEAGKIEGREVLFGGTGEAGKAPPEIPPGNQQSALAESLQENGQLLEAGRESARENEQHKAAEREPAQDGGQYAGTERAQDGGRYAGTEPAQSTRQYAGTEPAQGTRQYAGIEPAQDGRQPTVTNSAYTSNSLFRDTRSADASSLPRDTRAADASPAPQDSRAADVGYALQDSSSADVGFLPRGTRSTDVGDVPQGNHSAATRPAQEKISSTPDGAALEKDPAAAKQDASPFPAAERKEPEQRQPVKDDTAELVLAQMRMESMGKDEEELLKAQRVQPPRELTNVLSQEPDGQISLVLPDRAAVEKQITGQIKIEDILAEWERMKKDNEEKCKEEVRQHVLQQTGPMFTEFEEAIRDGLLERLEKGETEGKARTESAEKILPEQTAENTQPKQTARNAQPPRTGQNQAGNLQPLQTARNAQPLQMTENVQPPRTGQNQAGNPQTAQAVRKEQSAADGQAPENPSRRETAKPEQTIGQGQAFGQEQPAGQERTVVQGQASGWEQPVVQGQAFGQEQPAGQERLASGGQSRKEPPHPSPQPAENLPPPDSAGHPAQPQIGAGHAEGALAPRAVGKPKPQMPDRLKQSKDMVQMQTAEMLKQITEAVQAQSPANIVSISEAAQARAAEKLKQPQPPERQGQSPPAGKQSQPQPAEQENHPHPAEEQTQQPAQGQNHHQPAQGQIQQQPGQGQPHQAPVQGQPHQAPAQEQPRQQPAGNRPQPTGQQAPEAQAPQTPEKAAESPASGDKVQDKRHPEAPEELPMDRDAPKIRGLTREERELYAPFIQSRSAKEQLVQAIDNVSMAAYTGNVVVTGEEGMDTLTFAKNMARELKMIDSNFSGKVAKISGQGLNQKDVGETLWRLNNGALIIYHASGMDTRTAASLYKSLQQEHLGIVIIMEDTKKAIQRLFLGTPELFGCFTARMDLEALSNDTLVSFGRRYAREMEYSIDEMGVLALHTRIEELQTIDHVVTVVEVKKIVDDAIRHASRKTLGHFFDILLAKRYDGEDMIILTEKDFA